jgi:gluconokinase
MHIFILMGVAGCGKTTIGRAASSRLSLPFIEADTLRSAALQKDLSEEVLFVWADQIVQACKGEGSKIIIVACSAFNRNMRKRLRGGLNGEVTYIHLAGSPRIVRNRLVAREGKAFDVDDLAGQYGALELPMRALTLDIAEPVDALTQKVVEVIQSHKSG